VCRASGTRELWPDPDTEVRFHREPRVAGLRVDLPAVRERVRVPVDAFLDQGVERAGDEGPNDGTWSHMSA